MKNIDTDQDDELRPEYDLNTLRIRRLGPQRKTFGAQTVRLELNVAEAFPNASSVNEALRFLLRITKENKFSALQITNTNYHVWPSYRRALPECY